MRYLAWISCGPKKYGISKAADSGESEPWTALASMDEAKSLRIVPGGRLGGIGGAHEIAEPGDRVVALEHHGHDRPLDHEGAEAREEGPRLVDGVEARGLLGAEAHELGGEDRESGLLEAGDDLPGDALGDGVGLDDGERALDGHGSLTGC